MSLMSMPVGGICVGLGIWAASAASLVVLIVLALSSRCDLRVSEKGVASPAVALPVYRSAVVADPTLLNHFVMTMTSTGWVIQGDDLCKHLPLQVGRGER